MLVLCLQFIKSLVYQFTLITLASSWINFCFTEFEKSYLGYVYGYRTIHIFPNPFNSTLKILKFYDI